MMKNLQLPPSVSPSSSMSTLLVGVLLLLLQQSSFFFIPINAQQPYVNNIQLNCDRNDTSSLGYLCNNNDASCSSYLTFRSQPPLYNTPSSIATLLRSDPIDITRINNISSTDSIIPSNTLLIIPISTCSCSYPLPSSSSSSPSQRQRQLFYQHNSSYIFNNPDETYFSISNNTYQGLTTCQALFNHNPYNYLQLAIGMNISIPLRCACPTPNQTSNGIRYLLTYLITWEDSVSSIASTFGLPDYQTVLDANQLSSTDTIYPFTPLLVPLTTEPTSIGVSTSPPSPPPPPTIPIGGNGDNNSSRTWVFVGVGIGIGLLLLSLSGFLFWYFRRTSRVPAAAAPHQTPKTDRVAGSSDYTSITMPDSSSWSMSAEGLRLATESLTVYNYQDLKAATGNFSEENRLNGQVYRGSFKGDYAAVKIMKGDVSGEINILKLINHSNIIRLSGFCLHQGNTYLVYEYAENGSLDDCLCRTTAAKHPTPYVLGWKERVQIAYDIADGLNYLHNFANPPYIHKNLKSSNVLLDTHMRAKITNFGLARSVNENEEGLQLTRHVVGTYGYMPPEYIENGLITPKMDVFALGVIMLELLSGKDAAPAHDKEAEDKDQELQLYARIAEVLGGENAREKVRGLMDTNLKHDYPLDLAYSMAQLANSCVAHDLNSRPSASELLMTLSKILSSSMNWDPSDDQLSRSLSLGR